MPKVQGNIRIEAEVMGWLRERAERKPYPLEPCRNHLVRKRGKIVRLCRSALYPRPERQGFKARRIKISVSFNFAAFIPKAGESLIGKVIDGSARGSAQDSYG